MGSDATGELRSLHFYSCVTFDGEIGLLISQVQQNTQTLRKTGIVKMSASVIIGLYPFSLCAKGIKCETQTIGQSGFMAIQIELLRVMYNVTVQCYVASNDT